MGDSPTVQCSSSCSAEQFLPPLLNTATVRRVSPPAVAKNKDRYLCSLNKQVSFKALNAETIRKPVISYSRQGPRACLLSETASESGAAAATTQMVSLPAVLNCRNWNCFKRLLFQPLLLICILLSFSVHVCFLLCWYLRLGLKQALNPI